MGTVWDMSSLWHIEIELLLVTHLHFTHSIARGDLSSKVFLGLCSHASMFYAFVGPDPDQVLPNSWVCSLQLTFIQNIMFATPICILHLIFQNIVK